MLKYQYDDGGRKECGHKGTGSDCVTRAITIALNTDYRFVWKTLTQQKRLLSYGTANGGMNYRIYEPFLQCRGWKITNLSEKEQYALRWHRPTKKTVILLLKERNKKGSHLVCVKGDKLHDSWDCLKERNYYVIRVYEKMNRKERKAYLTRMRASFGKWNYSRTPRKKKGENQ